MVLVFIKEAFPMEVTAMGSVAILLAFDIIDSKEAISGFSNPAVITIGAIFILSRALVKTGFLEVIADKVSKGFGSYKWIAIIFFLINVSLISAFINNTAAVAIFIPLAIDLCQRFNISPTKILLPLSYAAIFGGTLTLIGTSTNLIVNSIITQIGTYNVEGKDLILEPFSMFEFTKLGLIFLFIGTIYNMII